ncbi:antibiotic biosynthesis monooxygenase family protein [Actinokineospora enzanensis]|uniref:antibiotic biosynthesis monooxygenase family protein n=1 Tax=Actinokineospora enzanensis TaxID=155975 RepID=UPI00037B77E6|nr:antibiotic biosynthesis monooxygenase [Actinokineospora enzanensis]
MFTFINSFKVTGPTADFEAALGRISAHMSSRPGFRWAKLYRSIRDADVYVEMAEWDDAASHRAATQEPGFQANIGSLMAVATAEPGPFELLADHEGQPVA